MEPSSDQITLCLDSQAQETIGQRDITLKVKYSKSYINILVVMTLMDQIGISTTIYYIIIMDISFRC